MPLPYGIALASSGSLAGYIPRRRILNPSAAMNAWHAIFGQYSHTGYVYYRYESGPWHAHMPPAEWSHWNLLMSQYIRVRMIAYRRNVAPPPAPPGWWSANYTPGDTIAGTVSTWTPSARPPPEDITPTPWVAAVYEGPVPPWPPVDSPTVYRADETGFLAIASP